MVTLKGRECSMYVVYYGQWKLLPNLKISTARRAHRETSVGVARKRKLHYSVYVFMTDGRYLAYVVNAIPRWSVWSLKEKWWYQGKHPAMLQIFSFLIPFLLILRCAACHAQERPNITFAFSNWVPFTYEDERGNVQGLYIGILEEIFAKQLRFDMTFQIVPWKRAQYNLQTGLSDLGITVPTEERMQYSIPSDVPDLDLFLQVYTYYNHPKLEAISRQSPQLRIFRSYNSWQLQTSVMNGTKIILTGWRQPLNMSQARRVPFRLLLPNVRI